MYSAYDTSGHLKVSGPELDAVTHKIAHAMLGGVIGGIQGDALAGAIGGAVSESIMEFFKEDTHKICAQVALEAHQRGLDPDSDECKHHLHQGTTYANTHNRFQGGEVHSDSVPDYHYIDTSEQKGGKYGSKVTITTHSQTPVGVTQPHYQGYTVLDVEKFTGEGSVFQGVTVDQTKYMELRPFIVTALSQMTTSNKWLGTSSGNKVIQGQEQLVNSRIEGEFFSGRADEGEAENILKLTSTILDLSASQIEKMVLEDVYTPKSWYCQQRRGNMKIVAPVVGLMVCLATCGAASGYFTFIQNMILKEMATAAFVGVCSTAASSLVSHQGDLGKVSKDLLHHKTLKSLAITAATAGTMKGLCEKIPGLSNQGRLSQRFLYSLTSSAVKLHLEMALKGGSYEELAKGYLAQGVVASLQGYLAAEIGGTFKEGTLETFSRYILQGSLGALSSTALREGSLVGALGAVVSEGVSECLYEAQLGDLVKETQDWERQLLETDAGETLTLAQRTSLLERYTAEVKSLQQNCALMGKYAALAAAVIAKEDPVAVLNAADVVLTEDFLKRRLPTAELIFSTLHPFTQQFSGSGQETGLFRRYELLGGIEKALAEGGATASEVQGILEDKGLQRLVDRSVGYKEEASFPSSSSSSKKHPKITITRGQVDPLYRALGVMQEGAVVLGDFAERYPSLTHLSLTAVQLTLSGPMGYAREQLLTAVGVSEAIETVASQAESYFSQNLQDRLGWSQEHADFTATGARFGATLGLGFVGLTSKDKILQTAKEVKERVNSYVKPKKVHGNSLSYIGDTHVYSVHRVSDGKVMKVGESTQGVRKRDGASKRAEAQARKLKQETGDLYYTKIRKEYPNKKEAKGYEAKVIKKARDIHGEGMLPLNKNGH